MLTSFKLYESVDNMEVIAKNRSFYSWEYDHQEANAQILLDKTDDSLYLKINFFASKTGLGAGTTRKELEFVKIGNLKKADLKLVRTLLVKHNQYHKKFSTHWEDEEGNKMTLSEIIEEHKPKKTDKKELSHIKTISDFNENKNIELLKYSDKSYALFGKDTKNIKDELINIGCKYNKFLTHPTTGEKTPGWIFSNNKLSLIQDLIK